MKCSDSQLYMYVKVLFTFSHTYKTTPVVIVLYRFCCHSTVYIHVVEWSTLYDSDSLYTCSNSPYSHLLHRSCILMVVIFYYTYSDSLSEHLVIVYMEM